MPKSSSSQSPDVASAETLPETLHLFDAHGVEVEYMLVDEFENGDVAWNNELALHVLELKCNGPRRSLSGLGRAFADNVALANAKLDSAGQRLMPTAMHPWMEPADVVLWPHGAREVYEA